MKDPDRPADIRALMGGPLASFLDRESADPLDLVGRIEHLEAAFEHWVRNAATWVPVIDRHEDQVLMLLDVVHRQQVTIGLLSEHLHQMLAERTDERSGLGSAVELLRRAQSHLRGLGPTLQEPEDLLEKSAVLGLSGGESLEGGGHLRHHVDG